MANTTKTPKKINIKNLRNGDIFISLFAIDDNRNRISRGDVLKFVSKAGPFLYVQKYGTFIKQWMDVFYVIDLESPDTVDGFIHANRKVFK